VLRAGRLVAQFDAAGADSAQLAEAMVGREVAPVARDRAQAPASDRVVCALRGARIDAADDRPALVDASFELRAGEVLAVAGVAGNGQRTLVDALCGLVALDAGTLEIDGHSLRADPRAFVRAGVARVPEDRQAVGTIGELSLWENALLEAYATPRFARHGFLRSTQARAHARGIVERFDVRGAGSLGIEAPARALSGGNLQKLILGRALTGAHDLPRAPRLIVAHQPTWGLDVGAVTDLHRRLLDACAQGAGVLLVSEDLDEILVLADRIAVMTRGRLTPAQPRADWTPAALGLAMGGTAAREAGEAAHAA
jgi:simple sugar transport system ATP-binding protein